MASGDEERVECSNCEREVGLDDAAMLNKKNSKGLWRYLCTECLTELQVPAGYELKRDVSFLRRGGGSEAAKPTDETTPTAPTGPRQTTATGPALIADFMGRIAGAAIADESLRPGRVLMDRRRLILATDESRTTVPFHEIRDVNPHRDDEEGLRIAYGTDGGPEMAVVSAEATTLDRFQGVLFRALLSGTSVRYKHPIHADGEGDDPTVRSGTIDVKDDTIEIGAGPPVVIRLAEVTSVRTVGRDWPASAESVLALAVDDGETTLTELAVPMARLRGLLARFLRTAGAD